MSEDRSALIVTRRFRHANHELVADVLAINHADPEVHAKTPSETLSRTAPQISAKTCDGFSRAAIVPVAFRCCQLKTTTTRGAKR